MVTICSIVSPFGKSEVVVVRLVNGVCTSGAVLVVSGIEALVTIRFT